MNLSILKKSLHEGDVLQVIGDNVLSGSLCMMKIRVTKMTTRGFYYVVNDEVRENSCYDYTMMNDGKGAYMEFGKANTWEFGNYSMCYLYCTKKNHSFLGNEFSFTIENPYNK